MLRVESVPAGRIANEQQRAAFLLALLEVVEQCVQREVRP